MNDMNINLSLLDYTSHILERIPSILTRTSRTKFRDAADAHFPDGLGAEEEAACIAWALTQIDEAQKTLAGVRETFEEQMKHLPEPENRPIAAQDRGKEVQLIVRDEMGNDTGIRQKVGILNQYRYNRACVQIDVEGNTGYVPYNVCDLEVAEEENA